MSSAGAPNTPLVNVSQKALTPSHWTNRTTSKLSVRTLSRGPVSGEMEPGHPVVPRNAGPTVANQHQQALVAAGLQGSSSFPVPVPAPSPSFQPSVNQDATTGTLLMNPHAAAHAAAAAMAAAAAHQMAQQHAQAQHKAGNSQTGGSRPIPFSGAPAINTSVGYFQDPNSQRDGAGPPLVPQSSAPIGAARTESTSLPDSTTSNASSAPLTAAAAPSPSATAAQAIAVHNQQAPLPSSNHQLALSQVAAFLAASNSQAFQGGGVMNHAALIPIAAALVQSAQQQAQQQTSATQQNQAAVVAALAASAAQQQRQPLPQLHHQHHPSSQHNPQPHFPTQASPQPSMTTHFPPPAPPSAPAVMQTTPKPAPAPASLNSHTITATSTQAHPPSASPSVQGLGNHTVTAAAAAAHAVAAAAAASQARSPAPSTTSISQHQPRRSSSSSASLPTNATGVNPTTAVAVANVATKQAAGAAAAAATPLMLGSMQNWKLEQLEAHVHLLREAGQMIPQPVAVLLAEARRREEKRTAKRVANRKSACTSRARKKALVEEMTRTNARLRRQALILALLPDLVVAITIKGEITFCSAQVERVLRHKIDDLTGADISDILVPASRDALRRLIDELVVAERAAAFSAAGMGGEHGCSGSGGGNDDPAVVSAQSDQSLSFPLSVVNVKNRPNQNGDSDSSGNKTNNHSGDPSLCRSTTLSSFSMHSCAEDQQQRPKRKPVHQQEQSVCSDGAVISKKQKCHAVDPLQSRQNRGSSAESSLSSSDDKNLRKANEALSQNVRSHNAKMKVDAVSQTAEHTDDVTGASVTANNADARLSSLQHNPPLDKKSKSTDRQVSKGASALAYESNEENSLNSSDSLLAGVEENNRGKCSSEAQRDVGNRVRNSSPNGNLSEDSGYRESGESMPSREDTSSSGSETSNNSRNGQSKPLAPTCSICLIRDDLTTIWCEVTSSIRTRCLDDEMANPTASTSVGSNAVETKKNNSPGVGSTSKSGSKSSSSSLDSSQLSTANEVKELLLCLRPIRDGEGKVGEELRFVPLSKRTKREAPEQLPSGAPPAITSSNTDVPIHEASKSRDDVDSGGSSVTASGVSSNDDGSRKKQGPMKKRMLMETVQKNSLGAGSASSQESEKRRRIASLQDQTTDTEKSAVESLMLMSSNEL